MGRAPVRHDREGGSRPTGTGQRDRVLLCDGGRRYDAAPMLATIHGRHPSVFIRGFIARLLGTACSGEVCIATTNAGFRLMAYLLLACASAWRGNGAGVGRRMSLPQGGVRDGSEVGDVHRTASWKGSPGKS